jgi:hypothetical protein
VEENHKSFYQEEGVIVIQPIFDDIFEEALGFRVFSEHGGGHGTTEEEPHSPPRWHEGHKELVHEVHRTSRAYGRAARPTSSINMIIRSTSIHFAVLRTWIHHLVAGGGKYISGDERGGFKVAKVNLLLLDATLRLFIQGKEDWLQEGLLVPARKNKKRKNCRRRILLGTRGR